MERLTLMLYSVMILLLLGCSSIGKAGNEIRAIQDPTERGLAYIAAAIIVSAIIRVIAS